MPQRTAPVGCVRSPVRTQGPNRDASWRIRVPAFPISASTRANRLLFAAAPHVSDFVSHVQDRLLLGTAIRTVLDSFDSICAGDVTRAMNALNRRTINSGSNN